MSHEENEVQTCSKKSQEKLVLNSFVFSVLRVLKFSLSKRGSHFVINRRGRLRLINRYSINYIVYLWAIMSYKILKSQECPPTKAVPPVQPPLMIQPMVVAYTNTVPPAMVFPPPQQPMVTFTSLPMVQFCLSYKYTCFIMCIIA